MLYYEKFVTNTMFSKERIKTQEFVRTFCCLTFTPFICSVAQTFCHYLRLHHVLLDGFTLMVLHCSFLIGFCFVSFCKTGSPCIIQVGLEPIILHPASSVAGPLATISRPCYSLQKACSRHTSDEPIT